MSRVHWRALLLNRVERRERSRDRAYMKKGRAGRTPHGQSHLPRIVVSERPAARYCAGSQRHRYRYRSGTHQMDVTGSGHQLPLERVLSNVGDPEPLPRLVHRFAGFPGHGSAESVPCSRRCACSVFRCRLTEMKVFRVSAEIISAPDHTNAARRIKSEPQNRRSPALTSDPSSSFPRKRMSFHSRCAQTPASWCLDC
jgi:hypothetical protein